jgi:TonB-linked SusC/RagA family outer membrane protein
MRYNYYFSFIVAMLFSFGALAQVTVKGTVTSKEDNSPLPGVTVVLKNTTRGTVTDINGKYEIQADSLGQEIVFSFIGMKTVVMRAGSGPLNIQMEQGVQLNEVVVTALGFEANKDELGSAQTTIEGGLIQETGEARLINNLAGKSAGVNITQATGDPGAGSKIQIRGASSITGDNQPLIVLDGIPIFNDSYYGEAYGGQQTTSSGSLGSGGGVTQQSRLNDLNPNDIENVEVIRGASAAAIWGSRAMNGVIMITTKKGKQGATKNFSVNVNSAVAFEQLNRKVPLQDRWGQGISMSYLDGAPTGGARSLSWGDKISDRSGGADEFISDPNDPNYRGYYVDRHSGNTYYRIADGDAFTELSDGTYNVHGGKNSRETYDLYDQIFKTGFTFDNSISISSGGPNGSVLFSIADLNQDGIVLKNSNYRRTSAMINASTRLNDQWKMSGSARYVSTRSNRIQMGSNLNGLYLGGLRNPADFNMEDYEGTYFDPSGAIFDGVQRSYRNSIGALSDPNASQRQSGYGYDNPLFMMRNSPSENVVNRTLGKLQLEYEPLAWLNLTARGGWDHYDDVRSDFYHHYSSGSNSQGRYVTENITSTQLNFDLIARMTFDLTDDIQMPVLLGANINDRTFNTDASDVRGFTNRLSPPQSINSSPSQRFPNNSAERIFSNSFYGTVSLNMFQQLFVNVSGRLDRYSTLPVANNTVFYPSIDAAWQFHEYLGNQNILSFAKLRAGIGQVGRDPSAYSLRTYFIQPTAAIEGYGEGWGPGVDPSSDIYGGGNAQSNVAGNPDLRPEIKTEWEVGTDLRFFEDRLTLGFTYYQNTTKDLIIQVDVAPSTGFAQQLSNAAEIENKGFEIELGARAIQTQKGFTWDIFGNYTQNRNKVTQMSGVNSVFLAGFAGGSSRAVVGEQLGVLWGGTWARNENGSFILDANGFPTQGEAEGVIGDPNPDFRFGIGNTFAYKGFELYILFDAAVGIDMWNGTKGALAYFGTAEYTDKTVTLTREQAGYVDAGGNYVEGTLKNFEGADAYSYYGPGHVNGPEGSMTVRGEIKDYGAGDVLVDEAWYISGPGSGFTGPEEQFVEDASWYRIRDVRLSYTFTKSQIKNVLGLESIKLNFSVNNAWLWTEYEGNDPDQTLTGAGLNGFGLDYFQNPSVRTYRFGVNLVF